jgi:hypothetical protein
MSILSAGLYTYISNTRFIARHLEEEDIWTLAIRQEKYRVIKYIGQDRPGNLENSHQLWSRRC